MASGQIDLSVIIPTYNESENIPILIQNIKTALDGIPHEIIVVDDNSPDRTWEVAEGIARNDSSVRVIRRLHDRGLSSAVISGMEVAAGRCFAVMDADMQHDEKILPQMLAEVSSGQTDIAIGSRGAEGGSYGTWSKRRRFISWVAATMAHIMLPVKVKDPMSGYFVISRDLFRRSAELINPRGFKILLEFIARLPGVRIKEIGYTFRLRVHGETKLSGLVIKNYLVALYDLRFGKIVSPTFLLYSIVGGTGVLVNIAGFGLGELIGLPHVITGLDRIDPLFLSVPFGIQLSILTNYVLNNYLTFYEHRFRGMENLRGFLYFELVSMLGLVVQTGVFQLLHSNGFLEGVVLEEIRSYLNNGIGIIVAVVSNYYLNVNFTWKRR